MQHKKKFAAKKIVQELKDFQMFLFSPNHKKEMNKKKHSWIADNINKYNMQNYYNFTLKT